MRFQGHRFYKIGNNWIFNLTEFVGYKVEVRDGKVEQFEEAFRVIKSEDHTDYNFQREMPIPLGVMRKSKSIIEDYLKEALIYV